MGRFALYGSGEARRELILPSSIVRVSFGDMLMKPKVSKVVYAMKPVAPILFLLMKPLVSLLETDGFLE